MKRKHVIILYSLLALAMAFFWCFEQVPNIMQSHNTPQEQGEAAAIMMRGLKTDVDTALNQNPTVSVSRQLQEYNSITGQLFMLLFACVTAALIVISSSISMWLEVCKSILSTFLGGKSPPVF